MARDRELHWAGLMRAAIRGDTASYRRLLTELAPVLRAVAMRGFARYRLGPEEAEDVVQETLLALHLKRHTWDERERLLPWLHAIAHNKLVDNLRRRGQRVHVPIEEIGDMAAVEERSDLMNGFDAQRVVATLKGRQRDIVQAISIEGASTRQVAERLGMTEGAVRVALHRALKSLAAAFRTGTP